MTREAISCSHGPVGRLPLPSLLLRPAAGRWLQELPGKERTR